jgi:hypothetical protein
MSTSTKPRPRVKPPRSVRLSLAPFGGNPGVVRITAGKEVNDYLLTPLASDFGTAYRLDKIGVEDGEPYHVCLDGTNHTCDCKGHARHGHCKHADGLVALRQAGQL